MGAKAEKQKQKHLVGVQEKKGAAVHIRFHPSEEEVDEIVSVASAASVEQPPAKKAMKKQQDKNRDQGRKRRRPSPPPPARAILSESTGTPTPPPTPPPQSVPKKIQHGGRTSLKRPSKRPSPMPSGPNTLQRGKRSSRRPSPSPSPSDSDRGVRSVKRPSPDPSSSESESGSDPDTPQLPSGLDWFAQYNLRSASPDDAPPAKRAKKHDGSRGKATAPEPVSREDVKQEKVESSAVRCAAEVKDGRPDEELDRESPSAASSALESRSPTPAVQQLSVGLSSPIQIKQSASGARATERGAEEPVAEVNAEDARSDSGAASKLRSESGEDDDAEESHETQPEEALKVEQDDEADQRVGTMLGGSLGTVLPALLGLQDQRSGKGEHDCALECEQCRTMARVLHALHRAGMLAACCGAK